MSSPRVGQRLDHVGDERVLRQPCRALHGGRGDLGIFVHHQRSKDFLDARVVPHESSGSSQLERRDRIGLLPPMTRQAPFEPRLDDTRRVCRVDVLRQTVESGRAHIRLVRLQQLRQNVCSRRRRS